MIGYVRLVEDGEIRKWCLFNERGEPLVLGGYVTVKTVANNRDMLVFSIH